MSNSTVAQMIVAALEQLGVARLYGVVGDSLNGIVDEVRRSQQLHWVGVRHEEAAAFAASAEAQLTNHLAVCAGSCGPGNLHLINGLYDAHRSRAPVLAIAAQIPSSELSSGYFQETRPEQLFAECSHFCAAVSSPSQMPRLLIQAVQHAIGLKGVAVLVIPGDLATATVETPLGDLGWLARQKAPRLEPSVQELDRLAGLLRDAERITLLCGRGCAEARSAVLALAERLQAPLVHALGGKEWLEYDNPFDVGMTGMIGFASGYHAMNECEVLLMLGTDFPYRNFYPQDASIVQIDSRPEQLGRRAPLAMGLVGDVGATIEALLPRLEAKPAPGRFLEAAQNHYRNARRDLDELAVGKPGESRVHPQYLTRMLDERAAADAIFTCDVGTPTVWAARYLRMNGQRRLLGSFMHGSMANALVQAIGAQSAAPTRQVIALCGDGGLTMLLGELATLRQLQLPVKVVVYNNHSLAFVALEQQAAGLLDTGCELVNPDFAALAQAMGYGGRAVADPGDLPEALDWLLATPGPALLDVAVYPLELVMPPKTSLAQAAHFGLFMMKAVLNGRGSEVVELARTNLFR